MAVSHYFINSACLIRPWCFNWSKHVDLCVVLPRSSTHVYLGIRIMLERHKQQCQQPCRVSVARIQWAKTSVWLGHCTNSTLYWENSLVSHSDQTASGTRVQIVSMVERTTFYPTRVLWSFEHLYIVNILINYSLQLFQLLWQLYKERRPKLMSLCFHYQHSAFKFTKQLKG